MKFVFTARKRQDVGEEYLSLEQQGLTGSIKRISGEGTSENPFLYNVNISNPSAKSWEGVIHTALLFDGQNPRFFLPGFMYGRNRGEAPLRVANEFPRLREGVSERPASPWWMVRADRLSHPAALVYTDGRIQGFSASPYYVEADESRIGWRPGVSGSFCQYAGFTCSLDKNHVGYTLGYENAPWMYIQSHNVKERAPLDENCFVLRPGETLNFELQVYDYNADGVRAVYEVVQSVYERYHEEPRELDGIAAAVTDISKAVAQYAWLERDKNYAGIVYEDEDGRFRYNKIFSISWTNGLSVAVPMLISGLRLGDGNMRNQALRCIENIVQNSLNPKSGLPFETMDEQGNWSNRGWWFDGMHTPGHAAYLTGQSLYYILKAYAYEKRIKNIEHPLWMEFAEKVLERLELTKNSEDEYPFILSAETGAGLEYDAFAGAWCMTALAFYSWLKSDKSRLSSLERSEQHYYEAYIKKAECYGAPLDTDKTIDSEGILSYIRGVRLLHMLTGKEQYLNHLRDALCYEYTFKFCYNSPIQIPPLGRIGWSSCGGSITSVANPHIHPMSSTVIDEMIYYTEHRSDVYVENRLRDTILWSCQTYNRFDREYDFGYKGWMSERFCHCEGLLVQKYPHGDLASTWFSLMPWACGSILEGLGGMCWDRGKTL